MTSINRIKPFGQNWAALVAKDNDWGKEPLHFQDYEPTLSMCELLPPLPASDSAPPASWIRRLMSWGTTWA